MIYFNISQPDANNHRLHLTQHNLAMALDKIKRLEEENERLHKAVAAGLRISQTGQASLHRIAELTADMEDARAENVRLTGQVHALLATIEASL